MNKKFSLYELYGVEGVCQDYFQVTMPERYSSDNQKIFSTMNAH